MVTIVMHQFDTDVQGAMDYIGDLHDRLAGAFLLTKDRLPSWGEPIDSQVARYVHGLGNWVRANDQWSFESQRYFGTKGLDIMKHREVKMLPKVNRTDGIVINIPSEEQLSTTIPTCPARVHDRIQKPTTPIMSPKVSHGSQIRLDMPLRILPAFVPLAVLVALICLFAVYMTILLPFVVKAYGYRSPWATALHCPAYCMANSMM
jgi:hypothetical protein